MLLFPLTAFAGEVSLFESVESTLKTHPEIKAYQDQIESQSYDLAKQKGKYLPSINAQLGYGVEQYSDYVTRSRDTGPVNEKWDSRSEAALIMTQRLYDGGEIKQQVAISEALLNNANLQLRAASQNKTMEAITAHLNCFCQNKLLILARNNLHIHEQITILLEKLEKAGAGNVGDVSQARARLVRAKTTVYHVKSELDRYRSQYVHLTGLNPDTFAYAQAAADLPPSLGQAGQILENNHPQIRIIQSEIKEAQARADLAKSKYIPKVNLDLATNYKDQVEGDASWQMDNTAMVRLQWNLFNGGQDKADVGEATAQIYKSRHLKDHKIKELKTRLESTWKSLKWLGEQKKSLWKTAEYSWATFQTYSRQFHLSQRSLLDVLSAENDFFQAASQLFSISTEEVARTYQIQQLTGHMHIEQSNDKVDEPEFFKRYTIDLKPAFMTDPRKSTKRLSTQITSMKTIGNQAIKSFVRWWALSQMKQDFQAYLDCYSTNFKPENGFTFQKWRAAKKDEISRPLFINISIDDPAGRHIDPETIEVSFIQKYSNDTFHNRTIKTLMVKIEENQLKIFKETTTSLPKPEPLKINLPENLSQIK